MLWTLLHFMNTFTIKADLNCQCPKGQYNTILGDLNYQCSKQQCKVSRRQQCSVCCRILNLQDFDLGSSKPVLLISKRTCLDVGNQGRMPEGLSDCGERQTP